MIVLVDMDGVLADFDRAFLVQWREKFPEETFIELEERTTFYIHDQYGEERRHMVRQITSGQGFFRNLPPVPDGIETFQALCAADHTVLICTAPLSASETCMQEKYDWVKHYLGKTVADHMVITKDKTLVRGDVLIDDRPEVKGLYKPTWEHVLFHQPYNAAVTNRRRMMSWRDGRAFFGLD